MSPVRRVNACVTPYGSFLYLTFTMDHDVKDLQRFAEICEQMKLDSVALFVLNQSGKRSDGSIPSLIRKLHRKCYNFSRLNTPSTSAIFPDNPVRKTDTFMGD